MEYIGYVYKIFCTITQKVYIGITTKPIQVRWNQHKNESFQENRPKNHFHDAIKKYGWESFEKEILLEIKSTNKDTLVESLKQLETFYVQKYNSYKEGYNSTIGGDGIIGDINCKAVDVYDEFGNYLDTCNSRVEAAAKYNVNASNVSDCCNRVIFTCGWLDGKRLIFRNTGDLVSEQELKKIQNIRKNTVVPVKSYDYYTGELIADYNSILEASDKTGISSDSISKCAKHKLLSTGIKGQRKLVWRLLNDSYTPNYQYEGFVDGKSIGKYVDSTIIKELYNISPTSLSNCILGKSQSAGRLDGKKICWKKINNLK